MGCLKKSLDYYISMKFSIIITCYDREKFISRCIRSALHQSGIDRSSYEVIVVDDMSRDNSRKIINEFNNIIKIIQNKKNFGLSYSRNRGIKVSKGKYVLLLDSDDYISEYFLKFMGSFLDFNKNWDAVASDYITVNINGKFIKRYSFKKEPIACGILYRKETMIKTGLYNKKMRYLEDKDFRDRYLKKFNVNVVELPLYRYTKHKNSLTGKFKIK